MMTRSQFPWIVLLAVGVVQGAADPVINKCSDGKDMMVRERCHTIKDPKHTFSVVQVKDYGECCGACDANEKCQSWTSNSSGCYLHDVWQHIWPTTSKAEPCSIIDWTPPAHQLHMWGRRGVSDRHEVMADCNKCVNDFEIFCMVDYKCYGLLDPRNPCKDRSQCFSQNFPTPLGVLGPCLCSECGNGECWNPGPGGAAAVLV